MLYRYYSLCCIVCLDRLLYYLGILFLKYLFHLSLQRPAGLPVCLAVAGLGGKGEGACRQTQLVLSIRPRDGVLGFRKVAHTWVTPENPNRRQTKMEAASPVPSEGEPQAAARAMQ